MAYEREAQTDIAELQRLAVGRVETDPPSGYERDAQTDVVELGRLARDLAESDPAAGGYERVGQTNIAVLRRKLLGGSGGPPTSYTLTGPSSGIINTASGLFTLTALPVGCVIPPESIILSIHHNAIAGTFTPSSLLTFDPGVPVVTFQFTGTAIGTGTISVFNDGGLPDPPELPFTITPAAATGYSLSGPSTGPVGTASSPFTVTLTPAGGTVAGTVTITPSDGGAGGTFTPATVGLTTAAPSATFTYTAASAGAKTISTTNNGGLSNPTGLTYTAAAGLSDGDPVSSWADSSGAGHTATQTGTARPTFKTNIINGKPVVRFNAAAFNKLNLVSPISSVSPFSVLAVAKGANAAACLGSNDATTSPFAVILSGTSAYSANRTGYVSFISVGTAPTDGFHVWAFRDGEMIGGGIGWLDGSALAGIGNALATTGNFELIGLQGPAATYSNGDIAEILFYNVTLSDTDRANLEKYLGTKYGRTVAGGSAVSPDTVTGLVGWWKADSLRPAGVYLLDNLISYWKLDEASGNRVDSTASALTLTPVNAPVGSAGKINNGCLFNAASSQALSHADNVLFQVNSEFTFSCWVRLDDVAAGASVIIGKDDGVTREYLLGHTAAGGFFFSINAVTAAVGSPATAGTWYHLACWVATDGICHLRINDATTYVSAATTGLISSNLFGIGARMVPGPQLMMTGIVDEVGFWKRLLSAAEITALYNGGAGLPYTSFVA